MARLRRLACTSLHRTCAEAAYRNECRVPAHLPHSCVFRYDVTLAQFLDRQWLSGPPAMFEDDRAIMDTSKSDAHTESFLLPPPPRSRGILSPEGSVMQVSDIRRKLLVLAVNRELVASAPVRPAISSVAQILEELQSPLARYSVLHATRLATRRSLHSHHSRARVPGSGPSHTCSCSYSATLSARCGCRRRGWAPCSKRPFGRRRRRAWRGYVPWRGRSVATQAARAPKQRSPVPKACTAFFFLIRADS